MINKIKNLRALTDEELKFVNENYIFELLENKYIVVSTKGFKRKVLHEVNEPFLISTSMRKISICIEAIQMWINEFKDDYTLIEVQNAIAVLTITYQDVNVEEVRKQLERKSSKIAVV